MMTQSMAVRFIPQSFPPDAGNSPGRQPGPAGSISPQPRVPLFHWTEAQECFPKTTRQRPHFVQERNVLGMLREVDDDEHFLALILWPRIISLSRTGRMKVEHPSPPPHPQACLRAWDAPTNRRCSRSGEIQLLEKWGDR